MKIILSRKGFDNGAGGCPSPLIPCDTHGNWIKLNSEKTKKWNDINSDWEDCTQNQVIQYKMYSIPIPQDAIDDFTLPYNSLCIQDTQGTKLTDVLNGITGKSIKSSLEYDSNNLRPIHMHLDPDIRKRAVSRPPNQKFHPVFGQCNGAEEFLQNQVIDKNDIFIFFGLFQEVYWTGKKWTFLDKNNGGIYAQVIWGHMKICDILTLQTPKDPQVTVGNIQNYIHTNVSTHPHMSPRYHKEDYNRIYIGDEKCTGVFECYDEARDLTCQMNSNFTTIPKYYYVNFWKNQSLVCLFDKAVTNFKVKDQYSTLQATTISQQHHYIFADFQWQEAVIDLGSDTKDCSNWLEKSGILKDCYQKNHQDKQNAKN